MAIGRWPTRSFSRPSESSRRDSSTAPNTVASFRSVYNRYLRCDSDPTYRREHESLRALLEPLFTTSFLIDDFLAESEFFGASTVLVSSASSKTAYGLGFCLARRRGQPGAPKVVGLTSPANLAFTRELGCYDVVVAYADVTTLPAGDRAVYVDMSGDATLRATVHGHWRDQLAYSCSVGGTHWQALGGGKGLPGPRPVLFFAPAQAKKRVAEWGASGFEQRLASAWQGFIERVADSQTPWLRVVAAQGRDAVQSTYAALARRARRRVGRPGAVAVIQASPAATRAPPRAGGVARAARGGSRDCR